MGWGTHMKEFKVAVKNIDEFVIRMDIATKGKLHYTISEIGNGYYKVVVKRAYKTKRDKRTGTYNIDKDFVYLDKRSYHKIDKWRITDKEMGWIP